MTGGSGSAAAARRCSSIWALPEHLTTGGMLEALNLLYDRESLYQLLEEAQI